MVLKRSTVIVGIGSLLILLITGQTTAGIRLNGNFNAESYGYQTSDGVDHLWLYPTLRLSAYVDDRPLSFHFTGGYLGDNADQYSASGRGRFTRGYIQYGNYQTTNQFRLGRFFVTQGVGFGTLDGAEVSHRFTGGSALAFYAGLMGHVSRDFEFADPSKGLSFGGALGYVPSSFPFAERNLIILSFTSQTRDDILIRERVGLQTMHRFHNGIRWTNHIQLRTQGELFYKGLSQLKWVQPEWNGSVEYAYALPDYADASWFNGFNDKGYNRIRFNYDRWLVKDRWGFGVDGTTLIYEEVGMRFGPYINTFFGQAGYHFDAGNRSKSSGPWVNLRYEPVDNLNLYAFAAQTSYQYDALDIDEFDMLSVNIGGDYELGFYPAMSVNAEFQMYQTPELTQDRRFRGGISWSFDTGEKRK